MILYCHPSVVYRDIDILWIKETRVCHWKKGTLSENISLFIEDLFRLINSFVKIRWQVVCVATLFFVYILRLWCETYVFYGLLTSSKPITCKHVIFSDFIFMGFFHWYRFGMVPGLNLCIYFCQKCTREAHKDSISMCLWL